MKNDVEIFDMTDMKVVKKMLDKIVDSADKIQDHFLLFDDTWVNILVANNDYEQIIDLYVLCKKVYNLMNLYESGKIQEDTS